MARRRDAKLSEKNANGANRAYLGFEARLWAMAETGLKRIFGRGK